MFSRQRKLKVVKHLNIVISGHAAWDHGNGYVPRLPNNIELVMYSGPGGSISDNKAWSIIHGKKAACYLTNHDQTVQKSSHLSQFFQKFPMSFQPGDQGCVHNFNVYSDKDVHLSLFRQGTSVSPPRLLRDFGNQAEMCLSDIIDYVAKLYDSFNVTLHFASCTGLYKDEELSGAFAHCSFATDEDIEMGQSSPRGRVLYKKD